MLEWILVDWLTAVVTDYEVPSFLFLIGRYSIPPSGTNSGNLTIVNAMVSDSSSYRCRASNSAAEGGIDTDPVFVTVLGTERVSLSLCFTACMLTSVSLGVKSI